MNKTLLRKYGYHVAIGMGDLSVFELLEIMQTEDGMPDATFEDAQIAIDAAYSEQHKYHSKLSEKSEGWEVLKQKRSVR
jgi:hypothetical protein